MIAQAPWPADAVERWATDRLKPYANNARTHSAAQVEQIAAAIQHWGWTSPILIDEAGGVIAGHGRLLAARALGLEAVPVMVARGWTEDQRRAYVLADNQIALNAGWDEDLLRAELGALAVDCDLGLLGFSADDLAELNPPGAGQADPDDVPDEPERPTSTAGDVWILGPHRAMCGDSTNAGSVAALVGADPVDCILTDPPYCSGGFQEAGKSAGSIGTRQRASIANDRLSTRGYLALMKAVLQAIDSPILYAFTDWRMWTNLFDIAESNGYGARSMIVWNKGTPGMGRGWRSQHEIILLGAQNAIPFSPQKSQGNVISCGRQSNDLHPTQKPVELIATIIGTTDFASTFYDPFGGSGTLIIACEGLGKRARVMELSPGLVDVTVRRWEQFTGQAATLEATGETFAEVKESRHAARPPAKADRVTRPRRQPAQAAD